MQGLPSRGDTVSRQSGNLVATVWQDTKPVTILSSQHDPHHCAEEKERRNWLICQMSTGHWGYNAYLGGVDLGDQNRGYYDQVMQVLSIYFLDFVGNLYPKFLHS